MRLLVTGAAGLLAAAIVREFGRRDDVLALDRTELDVTVTERCARVIADIRPDVVINCAAYNDVDGAEVDPVTAMNVNALAVRGLVAAARECGASIVHFSTDFVFDGNSDRAYVEEDRPNPLGIYGASKLLGEWLVLEHPAGYVLRVESLFGEPGSATKRAGSLGTIVARIRSGEPVPIFVDRAVSPTYTADVAAATRQLLMHRVAPGLYHCVNSGAATWHAIALEASRLLGLPLETKPLTLETASLRAPRPKYCALSNVKLRAAGISMPTWEDALKRHLLGTSAESSSSC